MGGGKLETVKRCAAYLVDQLLPTDELAIVTFDDIRRPGRAAAAGRRPTMKDAIAGITAGGMTNLSGGWLKAREELAARRRRPGPPRAAPHRRQANQGITDAGQLIGLAGQAPPAGIGTTTIGYGTDFDESLLTDMADAGGGVGWFAETVDDAPRIFAEEFTGLVQLAAQNLSVEVRPAASGPDHPHAQRLPERRARRRGADPARRRLRGPAAPVSSSSCTSPQLAALGPTKLADVVVRYVPSATPSSSTR